MLPSQILVPATRCKARTRVGDPCAARATSNGFCSIHSEPGRAAALGRMSGHARRCPETQTLVLPPPHTAGDLHHALSQIFSHVSSGQMDLRVGRTLGYIASVLIKTIEVSDHEIRLRAMEQMINSIGSGGIKE
jgi:hypothetical protein